MSVLGFDELRQVGTLCSESGNGTLQVSVRGTKVSRIEAIAPDVMREKARSNVFNHSDGPENRRGRMSPTCSVASPRHLGDHYMYSWPMT